MSTETVHLEGLAQCEKLVAQFQGQVLQNKLRSAVRAAAKPMQRQLQFEGDTPGHPHSFTKVPAAKISTHGGVTATVRPKSPLFNIFEPGAHAHQIAPGSSVTGRVGRHGGKPRKAALAGPAGSGGWDATGRKRKAAFFSAGPVQHPGMSARPILAAAFEAALPASEDAFAQAIFTMTEATA